MVVSDPSLLTKSEFVNVAMTAHLWLRVSCVPPAALVPWLQAQREEGGYTLVGLEQTSTSVPLPHYRWPARVVLVLGREREGVDLSVLEMLDATLEIPQTGRVRSLNVHVSGALAMFAYAHGPNQ